MVSHARLYDGSFQKLKVKKAFVGVMQITNLNRTAWVDHGGHATILFIGNDSQFEQTRREEKLFKGPPADFAAKRFFAKSSEMLRDAIDGSLCSDSEKRYFV